MRRCHYMLGRVLKRAINIILSVYAIKLQWSFGIQLELNQTFIKKTSFDLCTSNSVLSLDLSSIRDTITIFGYHK
jgi:hypothetical protein